MKYSKTILLLITFTMMSVSIDAGTLKGHVKYDGKPQPRKILVNVKGKIFSINPVINTISTNNFNS